MGVAIADLQAAADRLVKAGADLFMAWGPAAAHAAQHATTIDPDRGLYGRSRRKRAGRLYVTAGRQHDRGRPSGPATRCEAARSAPRAAAHGKADWPLN